MKKYDIAIVGAGAAGIMAAITAAKNGKNILLLEKNEIVGRKILATGNGRCNLTNKNIEVSRYHGANPDFISSILGQFNQFETMTFFENLGVILKEEDRGRIFPRTNQASTVVEALKHALDNQNVTQKLKTEIKSISYNNVFEIKSAEETFLAEKLILTTGGKAAFQFGSSGDGLFWSKNLGHTIEPIFAGLTPIETREEWVKDVQGIKVEAKVTALFDEKILKESFGDVLFTHYGLSGPAIMTVARELAPFADVGAEIILDLVPEYTKEKLDGKLAKLFETNSKKSLKNVLGGLLPLNLVPKVIEISKIADRKVAEISKKEREDLVFTLKSLTLTVKKIRPLKEAQVTRGGISAAEINENTLESKLIKNLYFAGEIIDVDADSGGFNLQWAWSSGYVAGKSASE